MDTATIPPTEFAPSQGDTKETTITTDQKIFFPRQESVEGERETMTGETFGTLVVVDDCIRVNHEKSGTSWLLIWPPEYSLKTENAAIQILNEDGNVVARVGDRVRIGGGEVKLSSFFDDTMKK